MDDYFSGSAGAAPRPPAPLPPPPVASNPFAVGAPTAAPAPPWPVHAQPQWGQPWAPPATGSSASVRVLIWIGVAVGVIIMMGVLAAIAIPVFLNQRGHGIADRTTVSVPADIEGMAPLTHPEGVAYVAKLERMPGPGDHVSGGFGANGIEVYVGAAHHYVSPGERADFLAGATEAERRELPGLAFREAAPGSLGGRMTCGRTDQADAVMCFFADEGSYGMVVVSGAGGDAERLAVVARESFVHRR